MYTERDNLTGERMQRDGAKDVEITGVIKSSAYEDAEAALALQDIARVVANRYCLGRSIDVRNRESVA